MHSRFFPFTAFLAILALTAPCGYAAAITTDEAFRFLVAAEGIKTYPYLDGTHWAVGVGHTLSGPRQSVYTNDDIYAFFDADLANARRICRKTVRNFDDLPADAQLVALSLAHNVGATGFTRFHDFRSLLSRRRFARAALALKHSRWWGQVSAMRAQDAFDRLAALD